MLELLEFGFVWAVAAPGAMLAFVWAVSGPGAWDGFALHMWLAFRRVPEAERQERVLAVMRRRDAARARNRRAGIDVRHP